MEDEAENLTSEEALPISPLKMSAGEAAEPGHWEVRTDTVGCM